MRQKILYLDFLKEAIAEEWTKILQEIIDVFKARLLRAIEVEGRHIERY